VSDPNFNIHVGDEQTEFSEVEPEQEEELPSTEDIYSVEGDADEIGTISYNFN
jgi:hypothetical protein